jgi:hypothetical protein
MAYHRSKQRIQFVRTVVLVGITLAVLLTVLSLSGCLSQEEVTYQDKFSQILDRYNNLAKNYEKIDSDFINQFNTLTETNMRIGTAEALPAFQQLVSTYLPQFQQYQPEFQKLQADAGAIQVPPRYSSAHSMLNSGISMTLSAVNERIRAIGMIANPSNWQEVNATLNSPLGYSGQAAKTINQAKHIVFPFPWSLIIEVTLGVVALVAGIIVIVSLRRRRQTVYLAAGPEGAAYPYPGSLPPPPGYGPPSEAYQYRPPSEVHHAPPDADL